MDTAWCITCDRAIRNDATALFCSARCAQLDALNTTLSYTPDDTPAFSFPLSCALHHLHPLSLCSFAVPLIAFLQPRPAASPESAAVLARAALPPPGF
ncbi:uncharacterized protein VTP21DRAFT_1224 [Calcarisporiella thermophila]|uniref:uncharacterized protein n=1 Tax=Calcarisporiella thermophila TaxID=911321 RepID=UPI00374425D6